MRPGRKFVNVDRPAAELSGVKPAAAHAPPGAGGWAATDFETANYDANSACALGVALVDEGRVSGTLYSLIRPPRIDFVPRFIGIHGITPDHVATAPTFAEVWEPVARLLAGRTLLAHNASFDMGVLWACLDHYRMARPPYRFACTVERPGRSGRDRPPTGSRPSPGGCGSRFTTTRPSPTLPPAPASASPPSPPPASPASTTSSRKHGFASPPCELSRKLNLNHPALTGPMASPRLGGLSL